MRTIALFLILLVYPVAGRLVAEDRGMVPPADGVWRVLPIGDSITEGGKGYSNWRWPLWERLTAGGYFVRYVGSRTSPSRVGPMSHEGHGGKNAEYLAERLSVHAAEMPADIVLLHAGHNHFASERPVAGIVSAHESIIASCRAANPRVVILMAKVIPSGKLPKYSHIPELNRALESLAGRLHSSESPVRVVDQAAGFDPALDTVADKVHPNETGAAKMAKRWFEALVEILPPPDGDHVMPRMLEYKKTPGGALHLHVFDPSDGAPAAPDGGRPAVVFLFGGGWTHGTPVQFFPECRYLAARGFVAISADYRIAATHGTSPFEALCDAKSALRHVRARAGDLGVNPARIAAAGASAGGQLAAACACVAGFDDPGDDHRVSARPDALLLWYPVVDNGPGGYGHERIGERYREFSPMHNVGKGFPPTLFFLGTADSHVPVSTALDFQRRLRGVGVRCELKLFENAGHPVYQYRAPDAAAKRAECLREVTRFLEDWTR